jgi:hypothetical protein
LYQLHLYFLLVQLNQYRRLNLFHRLLQLYQLRL